MHGIPSKTLDWSQTAHPYSSNLRRRGQQLLKNMRRESVHDALCSLLYCCELLLLHRKLAAALRGPPAVEVQELWVCQALKWLARTGNS
jgi:hypothetical protein